MTVIAFIKQTLRLRFKSAIHHFQQRAHIALCRMKTAFTKVSNVAEPLPDHIQTSIEMNNLCSTSDKKLSAKLGIYLFGLLQNMQILIIQKISVSFPSLFAHAPTMCKYFFERCVIFSKGRLQMDFLSVRDSAQHSGSAI